VTGNLSLFETVLTDWIFVHNSIDCRLTLDSYWAKPEHTLDLARYLNDNIAQVVSENPKRFIGLGTLPLQAPDLAVKELRRCINDLGLVGIQIGSHVNDWNLDAPDLFPIFEEAEKLGAVIFIHPWGMFCLLCEDLTV
jgi:aminocarboxymuconate-semialdehyde decarboxylase